MQNAGKTPTEGLWLALLLTLRPGVFYEDSATMDSCGKDAPSCGCGSQGLIRADLRQGLC